MGGVENDECENEGGEDEHFEENSQVQEVQKEEVVMFNENWPELESCFTPQILTDYMRNIGMDELWEIAEVFYWN